MKSKVGDIVFSNEVLSIEIGKKNTSGIIKKRFNGLGIVTKISYTRSNQRQCFVLGPECKGEWILSTKLDIMFSTHK